MNLKKVALIVVFDVLLLSELTLGVYMGSRSPDTIAWAFTKTFLPPAVVTFIAFRILLRRWFGEDAVTADVVSRGDGAEPH
jgi:hypothetical protein